MKPTKIITYTFGIAFVLTSLAGAGQTTAQPANEKTAPTKIRPTKEVVYKTTGDTKLKLHIFEPATHKATDQSTAIVFFFGGGWNGGTPKQFYEQSRFLAGEGVVCFAADYRVRSRHKVTPVECVADAKSAIRWVRQHAKELGINPNRIVAAGGSAGGHIAACTGVLQGQDETTEDASISSVPNAMILFNPVLDTSPETGFSPERFPKGKETVFSPNHNIRKGIAPTLLFHGTADKTVPFDQASQFTKRMKEAGNRCDLHSFKGKGHGFFNGKFFRPKNTDLKPYDKTLLESIKFLTSLDFLQPAKSEKESD